MEKYINKLILMMIFFGFSGSWAGEKKQEQEKFFPANVASFIWQKVLKPFETNFAPEQWMDRDKALWEIYFQFGKQVNPNASEQAKQEGKDRYDDLSHREMLRAFANEHPWYALRKDLQVLFLDAPLQFAGRHSYIANGIYYPALLSFLGLSGYGLKKAINNKVCKQALSKMDGAIAPIKEKVKKMVESGYTFLFHKKSKA